MTLLDLADFDVPMRMVYRLTVDLAAKSDHVALVQALTLDGARPFLGLQGKHGLFDSHEWWQSIYNGKMPLRYLHGIVNDVYEAGQDLCGENNSIDITLPDGAVESAGIYVNDPADIALFRVGKRVAIVYALDELKSQPARGGGINYVKHALEMAIEE
jgi:hypothetical protein